MQNMNNEETKTSNAEEKPQSNIVNNENNEKVIEYHSIECKITSIRLSPNH